ncbi:hypothetical protein E2C01_093215 [Portunus trituberculatus]|uniref:Uncharacterized protein n=1 Tax=Portunus trituberculatus TaxID=210409 RepID=A0A5B7JXI6_PORTR|nr:hypothetical protein [Portunus trituberculatus]
MRVSPRKVISMCSSVSVIFAWHVKSFSYSCTVTSRHTLSGMAGCRGAGRNLW